MAKKRENAYFRALKESNTDRLNEFDAKVEIPTEEEAGDSPTSFQTEQEEVQTKKRVAKRQRIHKKTTTYLADNQLDKLEELAHKYKKKRGKRVTWHDILRYLIDICSPEQILSAEIKSSKE